MARAAEIKDDDTQVDIDIEAANADISAELFGQGDDDDEGVEGAANAPSKDMPEGEGEAGKTEAEGDDQDSPPVDEGAPKAGEEGQPNSEEVQALGAPSTWTKEALEKWATVDPVVQAEILKREEDMFRGIEQYKGAAEIGAAYSKVVEPYAPILAAENIDPIQMFQSFAANHYLLTRGTPEQKIELAANLITGYKIPLAELLDYIVERGDNVAEPINPQVAALQKEVAELRGTVTSRVTAEQQQVSQRIEQEIEAFAKDPAHPYFDELADDIHKLFANGMASSLAEAYDKAVFANPSTRQKEIARLITEAQSAAAEAEKARKDKRAKSTGDHVEVGQTSRDGTVPTGSIDDTLSETLAAIESRG